MTRTERARIVTLIDANTDYDAKTIQFHSDGRISGKLDADKTFNGPHDDRLLIGWADDFAKGANPYEA